MITFHTETVAQIRNDIKELTQLHYEELALNQDKVPLRPQYHEYISKEKNGSLLIMAAREDGKLIGYFIGMIAPDLHYETCLTCHMDIFYVHRDKRKGTCGLKLFHAVEKELRRRGVRRWLMGSKVYADASPIFKRIGADLIETHYLKWLGE